MPVYPVPNNPLVVRAAMIYQRDVRTLVNVLHFAKAATWTLAEMTTLANALKTWWDTYYKLAIPPQISLTQVQVRLYDPSNPLAQDLAVSPAIIGTRGTVSEAANATSTISLRTGRAGRAYRGRIYIPGLSEADVQQNDQLASALTSILATAAFQLLTAGVPSLSAFPVIFHRPLPVGKPLDNLFQAVTGFVIENIVDSQRKRLPGRGR